MTGPHNERAHARSHLPFFGPSPHFYLALYGSKLGSEINMKEAQTRDVRVSSKGQGGWEKERARGGCAVQKGLLVEFVGHSLSL